MKKKKRKEKNKVGPKDYAFGLAYKLSPSDDGHALWCSFRTHIMVK